MILIIFLYILWVIFLIYMLIVIKKNPRRFDVIPNVEKYRSSVWYWPENKGYNKKDPPELITPYCAQYFIGSAIYFFASFAIIYYSSMPKLENTVRFIGEDTGTIITFFMCALYSVLISFYFPLFSKKPKAICFSSFHIYPKFPRSDKWVKMTRFVLIATVILFPFRILALSNKGYANRDEIVYHPFWSIVDQHYVYNDIVDVQIEKKGNIVTHCYLINTNGKKFDLIGNYINIDIPNGTIKDSVLQLVPEGLCEKILEILEL